MDVREWWLAPSDAAAAPAHPASAAGGAAASAESGILHDGAAGSGLGLRQWRVAAARSSGGVWFAAAADAGANGASSESNLLHDSAAGARLGVRERRVAASGSPGGSGVAASGESSTPRPASVLHGSMYDRAARPIMDLREWRMVASRLPAVARATGAAPARSVPAWHVHNA